MENSLKNNLIVSVVIILAVAIGAFFLVKNHPIKNVPDDVGNVVDVGNDTDTSAWETYSDGGVVFKAPETFATKYIHPVDWPPEVQVIQDPFACTNASEEEARAGKTEEKTINGHAYCVTEVVEGAAGSTYTEYAYGRTLPTGDMTLYFTFSTRAPECGNYDDPQKTACESEQANFSIDNLVDQIVQTSTID